MSNYRTLLVLQPTPFCNIDCRYCYLPERSNTRRMQMDVVRRIAVETLSSPLVEDPIVFLWHLGEPLAVPQAFYREAFAEISRINEAFGRSYIHSFQTNGTLIDSEWARFFEEFQIRVGLSIDGPQFIHDRLRVTRSGTGTHAAVMRGVSFLRQRNVPFSVITVLTDFALDFADELFQFFEEHGLDDVGFNIDEIEGINASSSFNQSLAAQRYKRFLARLIERSEARGGVLKIREVWTNLRSLATGSSAPYNTTNQPLRILNFKANGDFSTFCPELAAAKSPIHSDFVMGNILQDSIEDILGNPIYLQVQSEIQAGVAACKQKCGYWDFCGGGSPSNKFFEHGRFDVTETTTCRISKQAAVDVLLEHLETRLGSRETTAGR